MTRRGGSAALAGALVLLAGATAANLLGRAAGSPALWRAGAHLETVGICLAILAAALRVGSLARDGRQSRARPLGSLGLVLTSLVLFALGRWVRGDADLPPDPAHLLVEPLATVLLLTGAWLGRPSPRPAPGESQR